MCSPGLLLVGTLVLRAGLRAAAEGTLRAALERALRTALGTAGLLTGLVHLLEGFVQGLGVAVDIGQVLGLDGFLQEVAVGFNLGLDIGGHLVAVFLQEFPVAALKRELAAFVE